MGAVPSPALRRDGRPSASLVAPHRPCDIRPAPFRNTFIYNLDPIMSSPTAKEVIAAFSRVIRDQLEQGETVSVPELGTFSVEHQASEMKEDAEGQTYMAPPRDVVTFDPEQ